MTKKIKLLFIMFGLIALTLFSGCQDSFTNCMHYCKKDLEKQPTCYRHKWDGLICDNKTIKIEFEENCFNKCRNS